MTWTCLEVGTAEEVEEKEDDPRPLKRVGAAIANVGT